MRFLSFPNLLRTFHTVTNTTSAFFRSSPASTLGRTIYGTPQRAILYRSMPNIPFIGALFGSSSRMPDNTNYPVQKTEGEWQTELSPGTPPRIHFHIPHPSNTTQNSSASCARKAPSPPAPANSTSTTPTPASTRAPAATRRYTRRTTSSTLAAAGPRSGTPCLARSDSGRILAWA
jgi:hypothetical protein